MILNQFYKFFTKIFAEINKLRSYDGDLVDVAVGRMKPASVMNMALSTAKEQEWIGKIGQPDLTADAPKLFHYTRRKQFVWTVEFSQYFTEAERDTKFECFKVESITYAAVKINDATREIIFADFIRPRFN